MFRLNDSTKNHNGHAPVSVPAGAQEDGYWEALMHQGEVAALVDPPPGSATAMPVRPAPTIWTRLRTGTIGNMPDSCWSSGNAAICW